MNFYFYILCFVAAGIVVALVGYVVDSVRARAVRQADVDELRRRLQVVRLVVSDLLEAPGRESERQARIWLRDGDRLDDPHPLIREVRRRG